MSKTKLVWCVFLLLVFAGSASTTETAHAAHQPLALDGMGTTPHTCVNYPFCVQSKLLTTTKGHDVIILIALADNISRIIDSSGLTFAQRLSYTSELPCFEFPCAGLSARIWEFYARSNSPLSNDNITVVADNCCAGLQVVVINGANTRAVFDPNPSIPTKVTCPSLACGDCYGVGNPTPCVASIEASAIDFVIATTAINDADPCGWSPAAYRPPPGFTNIANGGLEVDYAITSMPQTTVVFSCSGTDVIAIVVDAISFYGAFGTG